LIGGRGDLRIETKIRGERFESVRGECVLEAIDTLGIFRSIHNDASLTRMFQKKFDTLNPLKFRFKEERENTSGRRGKGRWKTVPSVEPGSTRVEYRGSVYFLEIIGKC
jgi:hypothetical protein